MNQITKSKAYLALLMLNFIVSSCITPANNTAGVPEELEDSTASSVIASVVVNSPWSITRASEENVPLPIRYYLISESDVCVGVQIVEDASVSAEFQVPRGLYSLYALCGDLSNAPTQENANASSFYEFSTDGDCCIGHQAVAVNSYGGSYSVSISVNHVFSKAFLELTNVPETVEKISAEFKDLYNSVSLNQEYSGSTNLVVELTNELQNASVWNLPAMFVYPSIGTEMAIALHIQSSDDTEQIIETTTEYALKSGVFVALSAEFHTLSSVTTGGVVINNGWSETTGILNFWDGNVDTNKTVIEEQEDNTDNQSQNNINQNIESPVSISDLFKVGTQYGDTKTMILSAEDNGDGTASLLLLGTTLLSGVPDGLMLNVLEYDKTSLASLPTDSKWRIPSILEFSKISQTFDAATLGTIITSISGKTQTFSSTSKFLVSEKVIEYGSGNISKIETGPYYCLPVVSMIVDI